MVGSINRAGSIIVIPRNFGRVNYLRRVAMRVLGNFALGSIIKAGSIIGKDRVI